MEAQATAAMTRQALGAGTIAEAFRITAAERTEEVAIRTKQDAFTITWGELRERVDALAGGLAKLGVGPGDTVRVRVERDDEPRTVDVPPELTDALRDAADAAAVFESLSYTHRREYAGWVGEAKREETRRRRAEKAVTMLRSGVRHP